MHKWVADTAVSKVPSIALILALLLALGGVGPAMARAEVTLAALGDSLTQGYGLPPRDGLVPQLQAWLRSDGTDVTLINAGVSGDTTAGGAARIGWTLSDEVDGVIVALGANDLLRGIAPEVARANLTTILSAAKDAGVPVLLVGFAAPANYGDGYKAAFDRIYPDLAGEFGTLYAPNFFAGLPGGGADPALLTGLLQADGLHPNAAGVTRIVEGLGPYVRDLVRRTGP
ncbi:MAG: arylesterase [Marinibacterium sp.]